MFSARPSHNNSRRLVAAMVATLLLTSFLTMSSPPSPAQASSLGVGESVTIPFSGGAELWFGNHINTWDGARVYCAEFNIYPTTGWNQSYAGYQGSGFVTRSSGTGADETIYSKTISATDMTALNYILATWGDTTNANQAASVGYAVWVITTHPTVWSYQVGRSWFASGTAAFSGNGNYMVSLGRAYAANASGAGAGSAAMSFNVELGNNYLGDLTIDSLSPSPATGVITLTNGIFVSTGTASISSSAFTQGQSFDVRGVPPADGVPYKISASATFSGGLAANVGLYSTGSRQYLISAGSRTTMSATADDPFDRTVGFQPILTSQVDERYIASGDPLIDNVVFSIQADQTGVVNEWAVSTADGSYIRVVAKGTVYGPFPDLQLQAAVVPVGAPVAGTATVTTTNAEGPTVTYTATADNLATTAGYYVWVWEIEYDDQPAVTKIFLPSPDPVNGLDGYYWADEFSIHNETAIVVSDVVTTATPTGMAGYPITDTATVTGAVFAGAEIEFEAFLQVDNIPTCTVATLAFTSTRQPVPAEGDYTSDEFTPAVGGTYFWVETLYDDTGTVAHRGLCGEPAETTVVDQFALTTVATQSASPGAMTADTATIRGVLPTDSELMFSAHYSETSTPICSQANMVYTTSTPIAVPAGFHDEASFVSAAFDTTGLADGYLFWVETLYDDTGTMVAEGVCGAVGEITQLRTLASTGLNSNTGLEIPITVGVLLLLLGGFLATITVTRRRATTAL